MKAVAMIFDPDPPERIKNEKTLKNEVDWWTASLRIMGDNILKKINHFDINVID
jgi:hypothetical protein